MPGRKELADRDDRAKFEDAVLARYLARRPELDTRAKKLAFARAELEAHEAARERWCAPYYAVSSRATPTGSHHYTNTDDWATRCGAWRRLIFNLEVRT